MILTLVFCADRDCWMDELNAGMDQGTLTELGLRTPLSLSLSEEKRRLGGIRAGHGLQKNRVNFVRSLTK